MSLRLSRVRTAATSLLIVAATMAVGALPAAAGAPIFTADPTELPAGATTHAAGTCLRGTVHLTLFVGWAGDYGTPSGSPIAEADATFGSGNAQYDWTADVVVPIDAAPGSYTLRANCDSGQSNYYYRNVELIIDPAPETTTTTAAPTTTAPTTTTTLPPAAAPATAQPATPTYTG